jgi:hypothetical protein
MNVYHRKYLYEYLYDKFLVENRNDPDLVQALVLDWIHVSTSLLLSLGRYLYWWTISTRVYQSAQ